MPTYQEVTESHLKAYKTLLDQRTALVAEANKIEEENRPTKEYVEVIKKLAGVSATAKVYEDAYEVAKQIQARNFVLSKPVNGLLCKPNGSACDPVSASDLGFLQQEWFVKANTVAEICSSGACANVDPIVAMALIALDALVAELNKKEPFGKNNDLVKMIADIQKYGIFGGDNSFFRKPLGAVGDEINKIFQKASITGESNDIVKFRESILKGDSGEIANFVSDPGNYAVKAAENAAKAAGDAVQCVISLFSDC